MITRYITMITNILINVLSKHSSLLMQLEQGHGHQCHPWHGGSQAHFNMLYNVLHNIQSYITCYITY